MSRLKIRRALFSVSDKSGIEKLAMALSKAGAEIVATGKTATVLENAGLNITPIEEVSGNPEAFQGRMKTLSFNVCSGILFRRDDAKDLKDVGTLGIQPIDCVVVNFYPFEDALKSGDPQLIEQVDIGGPTLVRAAAKNSPHVLVLTSPESYSKVIRELDENGSVSFETCKAESARAWSLVSHYDEVIDWEFGKHRKLDLKYGENPHQVASARVLENSPLDWFVSPNGLSYNNVLDFSSAYELTAALKREFPLHTSVVIIKHNNPCGVASVEKSQTLQDRDAQWNALTRAWEGDPTSAFGGVVCFSDPISQASLEFLQEKFVEGVIAPTKDREPFLKELAPLLVKRKGLKFARIKAFEAQPLKHKVSVSGVELVQDFDLGLAPEEKELCSVSATAFPESIKPLGQFGVLVCRALKSNAIAIVRETPGLKGLQLIGAGQGQPNRIEAIKVLALPRAQAVLRETGGRLEDCVCVSDAFFPFRDSIDTLHSARVKHVIEPGGSKKDQESIDAANEHGMSLVFTGRRHFRH